MEGCQDFSRYTEFQKDLIEKYLISQEPYSHEEKQEIMSQFIKHYAWCIRYIYCHHICKCGNECELINNIKLQSPNSFESTV